MNDLLWWAYLHVNDSVQVKRYFDAQDLQDARESPLVTTIVGPFKAANRYDAWSHATAVLKT